MKMHFFATKLAALTAFAFVSLLASCCQQPTIYWSKFDPGPIPSYAIMRADLGCSDFTPVLTTTFGGQGVAVDDQAQKIYWAENAGNRIKVASLKNPKAEVFPDAGAYDDKEYRRFPTNVVFDPVGDQNGPRLFWASAGIKYDDSKPQIGSIEFAYTGKTDKSIHVLFRDESIATVSGIALDPRRGQRRVYWLKTTGELQSIDMDGKRKAPVDHGKVPAQQAYDLAFVPSRKKIFWVNTGHGSIGYATFENGKVSDPKCFNVSNSQPNSLFADLRAMRLYWGYSDPGTAITFIEWISLKEPLSTQPKINRLPFKTRATGIEVVYPR